MELKNLPNYKKAEIYKEDYANWKKNSLENCGYFPIFESFKETYLLKNLSGNALKLYLFLGLRSRNKTGETWVSIETIAKYFGKTNRTISIWIKELEEKKLIKRMQLERNKSSHTYLQPYGEHLLIQNYNEKEGK